MIANLHALFNSAWMSDEATSAELLFMLDRMLKGEAPTFRQEEDEAQPAFHYIYMQAGGFASSKEPKPGSIAVLEIKSPIFKYDQTCGPVGTQTMMELMRAWEGDSRITGVLIDIDSGGGQVAGTPEFANFIRNYDKPVVAYTNGTIASAAYYIAAAADRVVMHPDADRAGSIGAYVSFIDMRGAIEKQGAKVHEVYATKSTAKNEEIREAIKENYAPLITRVVDPVVEKFHADIRAYRPQLSEEVLNGRMFWPADALKLGLVDMLGTKEDALALFHELETQNSQNMSAKAKNFMLISLVLGLADGLNLTKSGLFGGKKGVFLSEDDLSKLEKALADGQDAEKQLEALQAKLAEQAKKNQAVADALTAAGVTPDAEGVQALVEQIAELGAAPAADPTTPVVKEERDPDDFLESTSIMDKLLKD